ncbi:hypothetical protein RB595_003195 [Gaeumannomyces hyphopodioides]
MEVMDLAPAPALFAGHKRKAETQEAHNERLSKRLSLLNLEKNGQKLYVPVENPAVRLPTSPPRRLAARAPTPPSPAPTPSTSPISEPVVAADSRYPVAPAAQDAMMQLDDSKYKVYIYNMDDELSSDSEPDEAKLVFLPDIEKHLRKSRVSMIPPAVPPNPQGELVGKELVLYSVPSSLSVPQEHDSVRKAIIDARTRARARAHPHSEPLSSPTNQPLVITPRMLSVGEGVPAASLSLSGDDCDAMDID